METKLMMGPGQNFFDLVWAGHFLSGRVLGNFPQKSQICQFFYLWVKKFSSDWVKKIPG